MCELTAARTTVDRSDTPADPLSSTAALQGVHPLSLDFVVTVERLRWNRITTCSVLTTTNCRPWARYSTDWHYIQDIIACPLAVIGD